MTQTPPPDGPEQEPPAGSQTGTQTEPPPRGPRVDSAQMRDLGRLRRSLSDRKVAGVAGGLGRHLDVDPTVLRVAFVVLCFFGGAGLVLYGAAWLLVPEEGAAEAKVSTSPGTRNTMLVIAGVFAALLLIGDGWGGFGFPWPLAIVALIVFAVLMSRDRPAPYAADEPLPPWAAAPDYRSAPAPRDRGPKLFWATLALMAIALGSLNLYDVTGGTVADSAYPALALAVVGGMLVLGSVFGRPGGLILLGLVATAVLAVSSVTSNYDVGSLNRSPQTVADLADEYHLAVGRMSIDLSGITDVEDLDGRTLQLGMRAGEIEVVVPQGLDVDVRADTRAGGELTLVRDGGQERENGNDVLTGQIDGGVGAPELDIDIDMFAGSVRVIQP